MAGKNKFGFEPLGPSPSPPARDRRPGPMGTAVREAAESLTEATEAKVAQRRANAVDARTFRAARAAGRVLETVPLDDVFTDDLPRDRLALEEVAASDEMAELRASIAQRGQKEPIELYRDGAGRLQLKKGWRRLTALRQLHAQTNEPRFAEVLARVEAGASDRLGRYLDMVEENTIREDLTFAEMAQLVLTAAADPDVAADAPEALVTELYGSLHKMKRSYIRSFVTLLENLGDALPFPKAVSRNLGVEVVRGVAAGQGGWTDLREALHGVATPAAQEQVLKRFVAEAGKASRPKKVGAKPEVPVLKVGPNTVTARRGECRIQSPRDFADMPRERLVRAIEAFEAALNAE